MHQTRAETSRKYPIPRKGTRYVARAFGYINDGVPVVIAVRDMLGLAQNAKEVEKMIQNKLIKLNGREVKERRESVRLFNVIEVGKSYKLSILPTGRFGFDETSDKTRIVKVIGKTDLRNKKVQINFHDGTNIISGEKVKTGDSVEIDFENKIKKVLPLQKNAEIFIDSGRNVGQTGKVVEIDKSRVRVKLKEREVALDKEHVFVL